VLYAQVFCWLIFFSEVFVFPIGRSPRSDYTTPLCAIVSGALAFQVYIGSPRCLVCALGVSHGVVVCIVLYVLSLGDIFRFVLEGRRSLVRVSLFDVAPYLLSWVHFVELAAPTTGTICPRAKSLNGGNDTSNRTLI